ncbi:MAG: CDP-glucose 4,6-dehydratase [Pseudomonadota bacterium]
MFNNIYQGRNVVLTGHTGFKGSWMAAWLNKLGANVYGYSLDIPTQPSHIELLNVSLSADERGDICNSTELHKFFDLAKPDIVFHFAAQSLVLPSYENPVETFSTNVQGTVNVLEEARLSQHTKAIVVATSDKCYENIESDKSYNEEDKLGGHDPYSASKGCAEIVVSSYQRSFHRKGLLYASVRAGNVIGGGDWAAGRLVPDIARAYYNNLNLNIRHPNAVRPWQHVLEPLSGYLLLGQKLLEGDGDFVGAWNFGPLDGEVQTVREIANLMSEIWDFSCSYDADLDHHHEAGLLVLDCSKARKKLNWRPIWSIEDTANKTAEWYSNYYQYQQVSTDNQFDEYIGDAKSNKAVWID